MVVKIADQREYVDIIAKEYNPKVTAIRKNKLSRPITSLLKRGYLSGNAILDYGCGFGVDADILNKNYNIKVKKYDKYNTAYNSGKLLKCKYETVYACSVFNVIADMDEFYQTIDILKSLSDNVYIAVRSDTGDIKDSWVYDNLRNGYWTNRSFQRFFNKKSVIEYFGNVQFIDISSGYILFKL